MFLSASATVTIVVTDRNDHVPKFTKKVYSATMSEHLPQGASITSVSATDQDIGENAKLRYTLDKKARQYFSMDTIEATNTGVLKVYHVSI